jgi:hypothetical protein
VVDGVFWKLASYQVSQVWLRPDRLNEHDSSGLFGRVFFPCC